MPYFRTSRRVGLTSLLMLTMVSSVSSHGTDTQWSLNTKHRVAFLHTQFTSVAYYVPSDPVRVLVLAHGFPWSDGTQSDEALADYARADVQRWANLAEENHVIVMAPAFGGHNFADYRDMVGRKVDPDEFLNMLVDGPAARLIPHSNGHFSLHGHSAGGQFAARYLVIHPNRLDQVILSAPSTYPFPDPALPWPFGMGPVIRDGFSGSLADGKDSNRVVGTAFSPNSAGWLVAATEVSVAVLVGSHDTEQRPDAPGQRGSTRIDRAKAWVTVMRHLAESQKHKATIQLVLAEGLTHDEVAMAIPAQKIFSQKWRSAAARPISRLR
jgi:pimeloyl-ACP methyl ester carboxylesterase